MSYLDDECAFVEEKQLDKTSGDNTEYCGSTNQRLLIEDHGRAPRESDSTLKSGMMSGSSPREEQGKACSRPREPHGQDLKSKREASMFSALLVYRKRDATG